MKILDLVDPQKSDIKFNHSQFPDGQQQVNIILDQPNKSVYVFIKSRLNNFMDLEKIICATKSLRELGVKEIHLYVPYFLGARSDRKFEDGSNHYLKDVICPIINRLKFQSVCSLDPHSYSLESCLNRFYKQDTASFYEWIRSAFDNKGINFVCPDAGAEKRVQIAQKIISNKSDIIACKKIRGNDGKISYFEVGFTYDSTGFCLEEENGFDFLIIDDICDGGATFINIAKEIKQKCPKQKIFLVATHGIFSKGFEQLSECIDGIFCTNSYSDINQSQVSYQSKNKNFFVKQYNLFK